MNTKLLGEFCNQTKREALDDLKRLWENLAETGSDSKQDACLELFGYLPENYCPACHWVEYAEESDKTCRSCPVKEWAERWDRGETSWMEAPCTDLGPYVEWLWASNEHDRKRAALEVLELINNSREETDQ